MSGRTDTAGLRDGLTAEDEQAILSELLNKWRWQFANCGLVIGACDVSAVGPREGGGMLHDYKVRLVHSNSTPVELLLFADRVIEEATRLLSALTFAEADRLLVSAIAARQALGLNTSKQEGEDKHRWASTDRNWRRHSLRSRTRRS